MSLIHELPDNQGSGAIVSAIIKLALDLNIKVVAEGVETTQQLAYLRKTICDLLQGFLFSEGVKPEKLEVLLKNGQQTSPIFH